MTIERTHLAHETRYVLRDGTDRRCILAFDTGPDGAGPAVWKILLPGPTDTEDLYGTQEFARPDAARLTAWLAPTVGRDAASELAMAVVNGKPIWRPDMSHQLRAACRQRLPAGKTALRDGQAHLRGRVRRRDARHLRHSATAQAPAQRARRGESCGRLGRFRRPSA
jgi:hypothetical protein